MNKIFSRFRGRKTYIVGILMILLGLAQSDNQIILEGIGFLTLRAGIGKIGK